MGREENVAVFQDTERLCKTNARLSEAVRRATAAQKLILEQDVLPAQNRGRFDERAVVVVSMKRTFEAASGYKGQKIAVHNFASATTPGGGVVKGSGAQEECLCRCSSLYFSINAQAMWDGYYKPHREADDPIHNDDIIYTPGVTVFKTDTANPKLMPESEWYDVDVITCAAPKLRDRAVRMKDSELTILHEKRLRRILEVAVSEGRDTIILGAFGCGAYMNSPEAVANASRLVIGDYLHAFKNIEFAVYCPLKDDRNYKTFARVLQEYCK